MANKKNVNWLTNLLGNGQNIKNKKSFYWILLLILIGMAFMIVSSFFNISQQVIPDTVQDSAKETAGIIDKNSTPQTMQDYEKIYENQLTEVITTMLGVDEVTVEVNLESTEELVVERDKSITEQITKERDKQGGTRDLSDMKKDEQVVLYRTDNNEQPLVLKTLKPKVRGVVIIANGAEKIQVKAMILEAVTRLLDVPSYRIAILPKKG